MSNIILKFMASFKVFFSLGIDIINLIPILLLHILYSMIHVLYIL